MLEQALIDGQRIHSGSSCLVPTAGAKPVPAVREDAGGAARQRVHPLCTTPGDGAGMDSCLSLKVISLEQEMSRGCWKPGHARGVLVLVALHAACGRGVSWQAAALSLLWGCLEIPPFLPHFACTRSSWAEEGEDITCFPIFPSGYLFNGSAERLGFGAH